MYRNSILAAIILSCGLFVSALMLNAVGQTNAPATADPNTYLAGVVAELQKQWPANRTINIVCHGHSVPSGYFKTPVVDTFNAYPHLLHVGLKERYPFAVVNVIVTAIGGENSEQGAVRFEKDVLTHRPDILLIDYALNDRPLGLVRAEKAWRQMIELAQKANIPLILLTPTADVAARLDDPNDPLNQHAEQIRRLATEYNTGLVDSLDGFKRYVASGGKLQDLMSQGNHPNRKGHDLVAAQLLRWFPTPPQAIKPLTSVVSDKSLRLNLLRADNINRSIRNG